MAIAGRGKPADGILTNDDAWATIFSYAGYHDDYEYAFAADFCADASCGAVVPEPSTVIGSGTKGHRMAMEDGSLSEGVAPPTSSDVPRSTPAENRFPSEQENCQPEEQRCARSHPSWVASSSYALYAVELHPKSPQ